MEESIFITGSTGNVGKRLIKKLSNKGTNILAGFRTKPINYPSDNIQSVKIDLENFRTLTEPANVADQIFLITPLHPKMVEMTENIVKVAEEYGISRIVKLSVLNANPESDTTLWRWHGKAEEIIKSSGINYSFLRPANFMQNFVNFYGESIRENNAFYLPHGEANVSLIDAWDIAEAAVQALNKQSHNDIYELTGPGYTKYELAELFSEILGREISYVDVPEETAEKSMLDMGMPEWMVKVFMEFNAKCKEGHLDVQKEDLKLLINEIPRDFSSFIMDNINVF